MTTITSLPLEIQSDILYLLPLEFCLVATNVCTLWRKIITTETRFCNDRYLNSFLPSWTSPEAVPQKETPSAMHYLFVSRESPASSPGWSSEWVLSLDGNSISYIVSNWDLGVSIDVSDSPILDEPVVWDRHTRGANQEVFGRARDQPDTEPWWTDAYLKVLFEIQGPEWNMTAHGWSGNPKATVKEVIRGILADFEGSGGYRAYHIPLRGMRIRIWSDGWWEKTPSQHGDWAVLCNLSWWVERMLKA